MSPVFSTLLLLDHVASGMVSLQTKVLAVWVIFFGLLYPLQVVLVGKRRCSGHWLVQYTAMAAYYLHTPLAFYAVHAVCSTSTSHLDESSFRSCMLMVVLFLGTSQLCSPHNTKSCVTNMRAYSPRDIDGPQDRPYRFVLSLVYIAHVEWEWIWNSSIKRGLLQQAQAVGLDLEWARNNRGLLPLLCISPSFLFTLFYLFEASRPSESTLDYEIKAVAEYMKRESKSSSPFFDDGGSSYGDGDANSSSLQLDCCRYPFTQRRKDGRWISIKDLSQRADLCREDQDMWLSYSLSRLLARRYYGFHCAEEGDAKVRRFTLARLGTDGGYKRAFTIVEVQLAFLYDYFFTTSLFIMETTSYTLQHNKMLRMTAKWHIPSFLVLLWALGEQNYWNSKVLRPGSYGSYLFWPVLTMFYMACTLIMPGERLLAIYWRPIHSVFHKLNLLQAPTSIIWSRFLRHIYCSPNELDVHSPYQTQTSTIYWSNKIGQYSVLLDYNRRRSHKKALVAWFQGLVRPQPWYKFMKHLPAEEKDIRVPDSVRKLVGETLQAIDGPPTNGTRSLKINMDSALYDWSWTCRQQTHTGTILIWHIATCYCDMSWHHSDQPDADFPRLMETDTFHEVAAALSRYCAYLVAFLPKLLPEYNLITKEVFQNAIQDAQCALGLMHMEEKEKYTRIQKLELLPQDRQTIFEKGVRLGRQLEELNSRLRWKVMAEFWAETILYVAPSDNVEAHIEHLAKGGEFVTHLWAMLSNAGILKRATGEWHPSTSTTIKGGPPKNIDTTKARTQECPF